MRAGASGYLGKHVSGPVLLAAVRRVASGETVFDREAARCPVNAPTAKVTGWHRSQIRNAPCSG